MLGPKARSSRSRSPPHSWSRRSAPCSPAESWSKLGPVTRVLILTASVGEGHDLPARTLADQLREECPGVDVVTEDGLQVMGKAFVLVNEHAPGAVFFHRAFHHLAHATYSLCLALR